MAVSSRAYTLPAFYAISMSSTANMSEEIDFICNSKDTTSLMGLHCNPNLASAEMDAVSENFGKANYKSQGIHITYACRSVTDERLHKIAAALAESVTGGEHQAVVAVCKSRAHIIVNKISFTDGRALFLSAALQSKIQDEAKKISQKNNIPPGRGGIKNNSMKYVPVPGR